MEYDTRKVPARPRRLEGLTMQKIAMKTPLVEMDEAETLRCNVGR